MSGIDCIVLVISLNRHVFKSDVQRKFKGLIKNLYLLCSMTVYPQKYGNFKTKKKHSLIED